MVVLDNPQGCFQSERFCDSERKFCCQNIWLEIYGKIYCGFRQGCSKVSYTMNVHLLGSKKHSEFLSILMCLFYFLLKM